MGRRADRSRRPSLKDESGTNPPLVVAPLARRDIATILQFTRSTWGPIQQRAYEVRLDEAFQQIARMPRIGQLAPDMPGTLRVFPVGSHVIVYRVSTANILVTRVLHQRMSPARHRRDR